MNITKNAQKNFDELFPSVGELPLYTTDPEMIEMLFNFSLGEIMEYGHLDKKTRLMVTLGTLIANQTLTEYKTMLIAALNVGVTPIEVKEIVYQAIPYLGVAKVVDFIHSTNDIFQQRGIKLPLERQSTVTPENRFEKGLELSKYIFEDFVDDMYKNSPDDQLHIQDYISAFAIGDFQTRKGLELKTRELIVFSIIISLADVQKPIKGYIKGNLKLGNTREDLNAVITQCLPFNGFPRTLDALKYLNEVIPPQKK